MLAAILLKAGYEVNREKAADELAALPPNVPAVPALYLGRGEAQARLKRLMLSSQRQQGSEGAAMARPRRCRPSRRGCAS